MLTHVRILRPVFTQSAGTVLPVARMLANGRVMVKVGNITAVVNPGEYEQVGKAPAVPQEEG
jgi:hypothetical protein